MDPVTGALVATGIGGLANYFGQKDTNSTNLDIARENRQWQQHMSNTAHQREKTDLMAAGLNPILTLGKGASTPPGATATMQNEMAAGITAAKEIAMASSQTSLNNQLTEQSKSQGDLNAAASNKQRTEEKILKTELSAREAESSYRKEKAEFDKNFIKADKLFNYGQKLINAVSTGAGIYGAGQAIKALPRRKKKNEMLINKKTGEIIRD